MKMSDDSTKTSGKPVNARLGSKGLGLGLVTGEQDVTLSNQDSVVTVIAEPDFDEIHAAFNEASQRAASVATSLDFSTDEAVSCSLSTLWAILDNARRAADLSLTRQYDHELAQIERREASYGGQMEKLAGELALLEDELACMAKAS